MSIQHPQRNLKGSDRQELELPTAVANTLDEARMILPGIQALFGFQLIAVFNNTFADKLSSGEQTLHLSAIVLTAVAAALIMAPAAYDRQTHPLEVSRGFVHLATAFLTLAMWPLLLSICLDVYLISNLILHSATSAFVIALSLGFFMVGLWFVLPRTYRV